MRSDPENRTPAQDSGGVGLQTEGMRRYVEGLNPGPHSRIEPKGLSEIAPGFAAFQSLLTVVAALEARWAYGCTGTGPVLPFAVTALDAFETPREGCR